MTIAMKLKNLEQCLVKETHEEPWNKHVYAYFDHFDEYGVFVDYRGIRHLFWRPTGRNELPNSGCSIDEYRKRLIQSAGVANNVINPTSK